MKTTIPLVSALISTFNRAHFLRAAIESVLQQTYPRVELIVVDDGSTDSTPAVCASYGKAVTYVRQKNCGLGFARERALKLASGDIIAWLDDDDRWLPGKVERIVNFLESNREYKWLHSDAVEVSASGEVVHDSYLAQYARAGLAMSGHVYEELLKACFPLTSTVAMRRECLDAVHGFFTSESYGADLDLFMRTSLYFPLGVLSEALVARTLQDRTEQRTNSVYDGVTRYSARLPVLRRLLDDGYPLTRRQRQLTRRALAVYHFKTAEAYHAVGQRHDARRHYIKSAARRQNVVRSAYGVVRCLTGL